MKIAIHILVAAFLAFSLQSEDSDLSLHSVVIDAGHGGKDPGAVSPDKKSYEKTFTLDISKKFAEKIKENFPEMNVFMTRDKDEFVSLNDRAERANKTGAQLFISIHINSSKSTSPNGVSVHILGESSSKDRDLFAYNMDVCRRENSVILLEDDYSTKYQGFDPNDQESFIFARLMQNAYLEQSLNMAQCLSVSFGKGPFKSCKGVWQNPFYVLWKTAMPAVLVELGFLSNNEDLRCLISKEDQVVSRLYAAFSAFKKKYDSAVDGDIDEIAISSDNKVQEVQNFDNNILYGVQVMAGHTLLMPTDKAFLGFEPEIVKVGDLYKYIIGVSSDPQKAKENYLEIKKKYSNCFIIKLQNGIISPYR